MLLAGSILSYSAGSTSLDPYKFRIVNTEDDRLGDIVACFPQLRASLGYGTPLVINCYPATLGIPSRATLVDTYLKPENFIRALSLAAGEDSTAIVCGQPLAVAQLITDYLATDKPFPNRVIFALGGYPCPRSLERMIRTKTEERGGTCTILFAYGVAEIDYGFLVGMDRDLSGSVLYRCVTKSLLPQVSGDGTLVVQVEDKLISTGDKALLVDDHFVVSNPERFNPLVLAELDTWTIDDWLVRTGHIHAVMPNQYHIQLRKGYPTKSETELEYYLFMQRWDSPLGNKPNWTIASGP